MGASKDLRTVQIVTTMAKTNVFRRIKNLLLCPVLAAGLIWGCPIYNLWHIVCPCCGVTRAWFAFLRGDTVLAFEYHALFPLIPLLVLGYAVRDRIRFLRSRGADTVMLAFAVLLFLYAVMRWCGIVVMP